MKTLKTIEPIVKSYKKNRMIDSIYIENNVKIWYILNDMWS